MIEYFIYDEFGLHIPGEVVLDLETNSFFFWLLN